MQIKGVFFDLGGTLFSYKFMAAKRQGADKAAARGMGSGIGLVLERLGIAAEPAEISRLWGAANRHVGQRFGAKSYFLHRDLFRETLSYFLAQLGHSADDKLFDQFHIRQRDALLDHMPIRQECCFALQQLKDRGVYLSIVSNIDDDYLYPIVGKHHLGHLLNDCTSSEEARSCKPDPGIFECALAKSGLDVSQVLFVGDSLQHDVAGAAAIGMRAAHIVEEGIETPLTHGLTVTADPTYVIHELTELVDIVERCNG